MSNIIPFNFESNEIRVSQNGDQILFNANDVCKALEYTNTRQAVDLHVEKDDVCKIDAIDSLGRIQKSNYINESGLYSLILFSKKEQAKKFKRWVTSEVLPSIRKTGSYSSKTKSRTFRNPSITTIERFCFAVAKDLVDLIPGLKPEMAAAYALNQIEVSTGQDVTHLMKALPAVIPEEQANLNATDIGKRMSISSRDVNLELANLKLLVRNNKDQWELTESGTAYGEAKPYHKNGHSGYQILWKESVIDLLINQRNLLKH